MSDLHANATAVSAVIADGRSQGVDRWIVLGDVAVMGSDPIEVLRLLLDLDAEFASTVFVAGNGERYVIAGDRPQPRLSDVQRDPELAAQALEVAGSFAWTTGAVESHGLVPFLAGFTSRHREVLAGGSRLLAIHASVIADDGPGIAPETSAAEYRRLFPDVGADLVLGGHTHERTDVVVDGVRFVNPGSVSNANGPDKRAAYAVVRPSDRGDAVDHRLVDYDVDEARRRLESCGLPGAGYVLNRHFT